MGNAELEDGARPPSLGPNGADKAIDHGRLRSRGAPSECASHRQRSAHLRFHIRSPPLDHRAICA
jgi:hypothetical protein